jgi:hypothetical protein
MRKKGKPCNVSDKKEGRRFSGEELYRLRNLIQIDMLIDLELGIPSKRIDGRFRFSCPLCHEFHTAVNPKTNLARCFDCERNFNPIDMVMIVKELGFVDSVRYLKQLLKETAT